MEEESWRELERMDERLSCQALMKWKFVLDLLVNRTKNYHPTQGRAAHQLLELSLSPKVDPKMNSGCPWKEEVQRP
jgi:hypothetical protein